MAEVIWNANGQGEFDFDYLLNLTSQDFVDAVKRDIGDDNDVLFIKIQELNNFVRSFVVSCGTVQIRFYDKKTGEISYNVFSYFDIEWIWDAWGAMDGKR